MSHRFLLFRHIDIHENLIGSLEFLAFRIAIVLLARKGPPIPRAVSETPLQSEILAQRLLFLEQRHGFVELTPGSKDPRLVAVAGRRPSFASRSLRLSQNRSVSWTMRSAASSSTSNWCSRHICITNAARPATSRRACWRSLKNIRRITKGTEAGAAGPQSSGRPSYSRMWRPRKLIYINP